MCRICAPYALSLFFTLTLFGIPVWGVNHCTCNHAHQRLRQIHFIRYKSEYIAHSFTSSVSLCRHSFRLISIRLELFLNTLWQMKCMASQWPGTLTQSNRLKKVRLTQTQTQIDWMKYERIIERKFSSSQLTFSFNRIGISNRWQPAQNQNSSLNYPNCKQMCVRMDQSDFSFKNGTFL